jgi:hypothetical protein
MIRTLTLSAFVGLGFVVLSGAALANEALPPPGQGTAQPAPSSTPPQTAQKDPLDEIVCRKEEATVGSRLGARKVCKTRRQWREERRNATSPDLPDGALQPGPGNKAPWGPSPS